MASAIVHQCIVSVARQSSDAARFMNSHFGLANQGRDCAGQRIDLPLAALP